MKKSYSDNSQLSNSYGFTLIEALVAIVVITIAIGALYSMQATTVQSNVKSKELTLTTAVANDLYERLWNTGYDNALLGDGGDGAALPLDHYIDRDPATGADEVIAGYRLEDSIEAITWEVETWPAGDGVDNDNDGQNDENDETDIKRVTLNVHYYNENFNTLGTREPTTIIFYKSRLF
jgi:prepilin-type N-terminal cleavage/methylation domain-containing protein